jgi:acyl carrier protein
MPATITPEAVEDKVAETLASFGPDRSEVVRDATFEQLDIDSLDLVELAQVIEEEFGVALKGDDVKDIKTVGEAIDLVVARGA